MCNFGNTSLARELETASRLARDAGLVIMESYQKGFKVETKKDESPVTTADKDANELIVTGLNDAFPEDAVLAEESIDDLARQKSRRMWCVDPLDGTKEFIEKNGMFVVMIGLAIDGEARAGVVYQPTEDLLLWGAEGRVGILEKGQPLSHSLSIGTELSEATMVVSRSHRSSTVREVASRFGLHKLEPIGSVGLKAAQIALGRAELYISTSDRMMEWDTCAPEAILRACGAMVTDVRGEPLRYNKTIPRTTHGLLASNGVIHPPALQALTALCKKRQWFIE